MDWQDIIFRLVLFALLTYGLIKFFGTRKNKGSAGGIGGKGGSGKQKRR